MLRRLAEKMLDLPGYEVESAKDDEVEIEAAEEAVEAEE